MPFINGKYVEYSPEEAEKIRLLTLLMEKQPRLERIVRPGEVATPFDFSVKGDIFPVFVVCGTTRTPFENRAAAKDFFAAETKKWEEMAAHAKTGGQGDGS